MTKSDTLILRKNNSNVTIRNENEIIHCKDCKYNSNTKGNYVNCDIIPQMFGKTPDDNYCSWAERKETGR